jgi:tetratricopeptide (TPR) repeat protein
LTSAAKSKREPWVWIFAGTGVVMVLAAIVFTWLALDSSSSAGSRNVAGAPARYTGKASPERYQLLARIEPPPSAPDSPRTAAAAFRLYTQRQYAAAKPRLERALEQQPDAVELRFYLGLCDLLSGSANDGIAQLRKVIAAGNTPYLEPAHFYCAKALLGRGDLAAARAQLEQAIALHAGMERQAQALLAQL